jgi:hypothetical protein
MSTPEDPALRALEKALEAEQERSRDADTQLRELQKQELAIAREILPVQGPPSAAMPQPTSGWTVDTAMAHLLALRQADREFYAERHRAEEKFQQERDRRLSEVAIEREKALKIKETADLAALGLAREIQTYKDEKANELRSQIESERGSYVTKTEAKPFFDFIIALQGRTQGIGSTANVGYLIAVLVLAGVSLWLGTR